MKAQSSISVKESPNVTFVNPVKAANIRALIFLTFCPTVIDVSVELREPTITG